jgi:hypothetical protein
VIIPVGRFSTRFTFNVAMIALTYYLTMLYAVHRQETWALVIGVAAAIYPWVPKLPESNEPEVKPEKYTLFPTED